jgi:hypothetical protein
MSRLALALLVLFLPVFAFAQAPKDTRERANVFRKYFPESVMSAAIHADEVAARVRYARAENEKRLRELSKALEKMIGRKDLTVDDFTRPYLEFLNTVKSITDLEVDMQEADAAVMAAHRRWNEESGESGVREKIFTDWLRAATLNYVPLPDGTLPLMGRAHARFLELANKEMVRLGSPSGPAAEKRRRLQELIDRIPKDSFRSSS